MSQPVQLDPWIKVETPHGAGWAIFYHDTSDEIWWTVALKETLAIVQYRNNKIRIARSYTLDLGLDDEALRNKIALPVDNSKPLK
jgi:hypothetical protein